MKKRIEEIDYIKNMMIDALEEPSKADSKGHCILNGEYVCHEDIPEVPPDGFDRSFLVCGEGEDPVYLVCILKIDPIIDTL